jgi:hypothetical protein
MRCKGHVACTGGSIHAYKGLIKTSERNNSIGKCRHRLDDNIKMDFKEIGWVRTHLEFCLL